MDYNTESLKRMIRQKLPGNYSITCSALLFCFCARIVVFLLINYIMASPRDYFSLFLRFAVEFVLMIFVSLLYFGFHKILLDIYYGKSPQTADIFYCFIHNSNEFLLLSTVLSMLNTAASLPLLFCILALPFGVPAPGMIWCICLAAVFWLISTIAIELHTSFASFLLLEEPGSSVSHVLSENLRLVRGHRLELFYLILSFTGVFLLGVLSLGIGFLWILPYYNGTLLAFYRALKDNN